MKWLAAGLAGALLVLGLLGGYLWYARSVQRLNALQARLEIASPPTVTPLTNRQPAAVVDLMTADGSALVQGRWRFSETTARLERTPGAWYRMDVVVPERVGRLDPNGTAILFEVVVDGYAEVWVNGQLQRLPGQAGGPSSRVVVGRDARPGQRFQLAVFAAKAPLSAPSADFRGLRAATLEFVPSQSPGMPAVGGVVKLRPALDTVVAQNASVEKVADRLLSSEGPVWAPDGYLLFSDFRANLIYRWSPDDGVSIFRSKSGYAGVDIADHSLPGSNGLAFDRERRLTIAEHGRRQVVRLERNGDVTVLADRYEGRRLNSPNDLVYKSDGSLYFTDPPFGLPATHNPGRRELPYSGIFRWVDGRLVLLNTDLKGPNGLAFSPDERYLYVANWDAENSAIMRYDAAADGGLVNGRVFFTLRGDGMKVDRNGNLYVAGPGGIWIISAAGEHLGTIRLPQEPNNVAWGNDDRRTLYMTASSSVYRIRLEISGSP
jgi:gluconolactonase